MGLPRNVPMTVSLLKEKTGDETNHYEGDPFSLSSIILDDSGC